MSTLKARNAPTKLKESGHPDRPDPYQQVTDLAANPGEWEDRRG